MRGFTRAACIAAAAGGILACGAIDARAGTVGIAEFHLLNDSGQTLLFNEDGLFGVTCWCGPFMSAIPPPQTTIAPGGAVDWFAATYVEGANIHWFAQWGVLTPEYPPNTAVSQYCTVGADTSTESLTQEHVVAVCGDSLGNTGPSYDLVSFVDSYTAFGGEGGFFTISPPPSLVAAPAPAPEPASLALLGVGLFGLGFLRCRPLWKSSQTRLRHEGQSSRSAV